MEHLHFPPFIETNAMRALRAEVRGFIAEHRDRARSYAYLGGDDPQFSRMLGQRGWIGMTWPRQYGGAERSVLERYVVSEELLAARMPLAAHWIADRQTGPLLLRYGTEAQRQALLPRIARGECRFCIGMSEADSGSDLASVRTTARPVPGGFRVNGAKLWTSSADVSDYMILFCRTAPRTDTRHEGLSQILIDLATPGITRRPIRNMAGDADFNEVVFDDVFIPADMLVGGLGQGWEQVNSELAFERSGPERFLSSFGLLVAAIDHLRALPSAAPDRAATAIGRLVAHLNTVRRLSRSVAAMLNAGETPALQAAMVKEIGTNLEQDIITVLRGLLDVEPDPTATDPLQVALTRTLVQAPSFTIRGGTREMLRSIIARGLGVR